VYYNVPVASVRLDPELERQIERAARKRKQSKSDFMRDAAREKANEVLNEEGKPSSLWDVVDAAGQGLDSTPIRTEWGEHLLERHKREVADFRRKLARRRARPG
jgi:predicted transcriptional regulator